MSQTLGRYTLLGKLATGGMAEVFLARLDGTSGFERRVVIKRVLPQYAAQPEFLRLFEQEARFASFLSHPHIATVSDFGVDETGAAYLVMEHVEGASLRTLLREAARLDERPDARLVSRIFSQVAEALAAVHSAVDPGTSRPLDLVHRDVSPENVLLSRQGAVKLADFGIARAMNEVSTTSPDVVRGKLRYLAPEQVLGEPLSPAIDVWALGVSLYEALTLRRPFPEDNEGQTVHAIVHGEYPPLASLRQDLSPELIAVVARCLRREPRERYPDCQDLALDLERLASAGTSSITTRVIGNWVERLAPAAELQPLPAPAGPTKASAVARPAEPRPVSMGEEIALEEGPALELNPAARAPEPVAVPEVKRARWPLVVGVLGVALLVAASVAFRARGPAPSTLRQVLVTSTPPGATVKYGETVLGKTPWAGDLPALHAVELEVSAPGFQAVKRTLQPGELAPVEVSLKKR
ncbi:MAG: protein kinase [Archangium sp.]|nr:protein kinase [Archangium sp.]